MGNDVLARTSDETEVGRAALEQAYRADAAYILTLAPALFVVGMTIETAGHWHGGPPLLFWTHFLMAVASVALFFALRRKLIWNQYPEWGLLTFWAFMLCSVATHAVASYPDDLRMAQLVLALTVVATGALILPTIAGYVALSVSALSLVILFAVEYSVDAIQWAAVPLAITFMSMLTFRARRWAIRQGERLRMLDRQLADSRSKAESAHRVAALSMRIGAGFAHHFNNQLQSAMLGAEGLRRHVGAGNPASDSLDVIEHSIRRGVDLTRQLLRYAQPRTVKKRELSASEFLEGLDLSSAVSSGRAVERRADEVVFEADELQLGLAIVELVRNADASMSSLADPIELKLVDLGESIEITVADTGRGIPKSLDCRLTEPFVTGDETRNFGLGLALVAQVVECHHGELSHRAGEGRGTIASIRMPRMLGDPGPTDNAAH